MHTYIQAYTSMYSHSRACPTWQDCFMYPLPQRFIHTQHVTNHVHTMPGRERNRQHRGYGFDTVPRHLPARDDQCAVWSLPVFGMPGWAVHFAPETVRMSGLQARHVFGAGKR